MNKSLQKKTLKSAKQLRLQMERSAQRNANLRVRLDNEMLKLQRKLSPLLERRDKLNICYTQLDKPTAESIVYSQFVELVARRLTPMDSKTRKM
jgi:hypothetical protein